MRLGLSQPGTRIDRPLSCCLDRLQKQKNSPRYLVSMKQGTGRCKPVEDHPYPGGLQEGDREREREIGTNSVRWAYSGGGINASLFSLPLFRRCYVCPWNKKGVCRSHLFPDILVTHDLSFIFRFSPSLANGSLLARVDRSSTILPNAVLDHPRSSILGIGLPT